MFVQLLSWSIMYLQFRHKEYYSYRAFGLSHMTRSRFTVATGRLALSITVDSDSIPHHEYHN